MRAQRLMYAGAGAGVIILLSAFFGWWCIEGHHLPWRDLWRDITMPAFGRSVLNVVPAQYSANPPDYTPPLAGTQMSNPQVRAAHTVGS